MFFSLASRGQSTYIFEFGPITSSQTSFLTSGLLNNNFSGINLGVCFHKQFKKFGLQYKLGVSRISQSTTGVEKVDIFDTESETINDKNLDNIHDFSFGVGGLLPIYKKYLFLSLDLSVLSVLEHKGRLNSDVYSYDYHTGKSTKTKSIEYTYQSFNSINPMIGLGTFFVIPIVRNFSIVGRMNLNFLLGSNEFKVRQTTTGSNVNGIYETKENRFYIDDYFKANLGIGYSIN